MRLVPQGGHIVTGDDIYGGTSRLLSRVAPQQGISVTNVDMNDLGAVQRAMQPNTQLLWIESPYAAREFERRALPRLTRPERCPG
eukprot:1656114-Prymnesium_polylepis.1